MGRRSRELRELVIGIWKMFLYKLVLKDDSVTVISSRRSRPG